MKLSILIVNWNTCDFLRQCLNSVWQAIQVFPPGEVETFVVDNDSHDDSVQMVRQEFPWVRLLENHENIGFACANNQAFRESRGEYVLLLNPDTVVDEEALHRLVTFADVHSDAGIVGACLVNPDGTLQKSCYPAPTLVREVWRLFHLDLFYRYSSYGIKDWQHQTSSAVDVVKGACLMLRRSALDRAEILDEDYFIYTEEVDLCQRVRQAGWKIYWVPGVQVIHYGGRSTRQIARQMFLRLHESKVVYFRKHYGRRTAQFYKLVLSIASLPRLLLGPLALLESSTRRRQHLALVGNYVYLLRMLPRL